MKWTTNKGRYGTNHGLFRQLQTVKTVSDSQDSCRISRQLQTVKRVSDSQDSFRMTRQLQKSRQLQNVLAFTPLPLDRNGMNNIIQGPIRYKPWPIQTAADCQASFKSQDCCRMSRKLQTVQTVSDCQDNCTQLQTGHTPTDCSRTLQTYLFLSVQWDTPLAKGWYQDHCLPFRKKPWYKWHTSFLALNIPHNAIHSIRDTRISVRPSSFLCPSGSRYPPGFWNGVDGRVQVKALSPEIEKEKNIFCMKKNVVSYNAILSCSALPFTNLYETVLGTVHPGLATRYFILGITVRPGKTVL